MNHLRAFYDVMLACNLQPPAWEVWSAYATDNAEFWPIMDRRQEKLIGGVLFKGHTVHIAIHPDHQKRWITKAMLAGYRQWTHDCEIVATPPVDNVAASNLAKRLGLVQRGATNDGQFHIFVKERTICQ